MRIDLNYGPQQAPAANRNEADTAAAQNNTSAAKVTSGEDQAQLSGAHSQVEALAAQASQLPEIREERVQALRQAVESRQYHADPEKVAGAIMNSMTLGPAA